MNYELSEDQESVVSALDSILEDYKTAPVEPVPFVYGTQLDATLAESGFLDIEWEDGFGPLDAALVVERVARMPEVVEVAASALLAPALPLDRGTRPIALHTGPLTAPIRFLPQACALVVLHPDHAEIATIAPADVEAVETLMAYPYGRLVAPEALRFARFEDAALVRRRWSIGIAAEAAGCMASALGVVLDHVKTRFAFGRPLGAFQAIQHRLAGCAEIAESTRWLALRGAWSDTAADAAIAAAYAQAHVAQFTFDLHQFSGAMGLTLEYPLHFWSYRLRALAGELGGASIQSRAAAAAVWGEAA